MGRNGHEGVTPSDFTERTQRYFIDRRFGYRTEGQIRNDGERTDLQRQMVNYRMPGTNEPVIVRRTPQGYELLEGWHRTMGMLLRGAPPDQIQNLQTGYNSQISFENWKPVLIKAFATQGDESQAMIGTGEYVPQDDPGTGDYLPTTSHTAA